MQIACKKFSCQKAVEVCYWTCKYRRDCKDWHGALDGTPGTDAITGQLSAAAKKSGRTFDPQTMIFTSSSKKKGKKSRAAVVSKSPSARFTPNGTPTAREEVESVAQAEPVSRTLTTKSNQRSNQKPNHRLNHGEVKAKTMEDNFATSTATESREMADSIAETPTKSAAAKAKPKPVAKPKPATTTGPVYLLLFANGKYKELRESDLNSEAAGVLRDPSLRLIKGQSLVPQISFKAVDE